MEGGRAAERRYVVLTMEDEKMQLEKRGGKVDVRKSGCYSLADFLISAI
jgi:hypothetical protein